MSKKKRTYGPSGSQLADDYMEYYIRIKVPMPHFEGEGMDAETFKEMLAKGDQIANKQSVSAKKRGAGVMSREDFLRIRSDPLAQTKRKALSAKKRMANALIYHSNQDERWWEDQQMEILKLLEDQRYRAKLGAWVTWKELFLERVEKRYKALAIDNPDIAKSFAKFGWEYAESKRPKNPKDRQRASMVIIRNVQRKAIRRQITELITLTDQLGPLISNKSAPKRIEKPKRKRKSKKEIPDGKTSVEDVFGDQQE